MKWLTGVSHENSLDWAVEWLSREQNCDQRLLLMSLMRTRSKGSLGSELMWKPLLQDQLPKPKGHKMSPRSKWTDGINLASEKENIDISELVSFFLLVDKGSVLKDMMGMGILELMINLSTITNIIYSCS